MPLLVPSTALLAGSSHAAPRAEVTSASFVCCTGRRRAIFAATCVIVICSEHARFPAVFSGGLFFCEFSDKPLTHPLNIHASQCAYIIDGKSIIGLHQTSPSQNQIPRSHYSTLRLQNSGWSGCRASWHRPLAVLCSSGIPKSWVPIVW